MRWQPSEHLDCRELAELAQQFYGDIEISRREFLEWQYHLNPAGDVIGYTARNENDKVVGQYVVIPQRLQYRGNSLVGSLSLNTLTHPAYMGKGIFRTLAELTYQTCAEKGVILTYGFPNPNSYPGFLNKLGFRDIGSLSVMGKYIGKLSGLTKPFTRSLKTDKIKVAEVFEFTQDYQDFWETFKNYYPLTVERTKIFMNWRYFQAPDRKYRVFMAYADGQVQGCLVSRVDKMKGIKTGLIVDFILRHDADGLLSGQYLLEKCLQCLKGEGAVLAICMLPGHTEEIKVLKKMKLRHIPRRLLPQPVPVILRTHLQNGLENIDEINNLSSWFLTMGDYDVG